MSEEKNTVSIVTWPKEPARLAHGFETPVSILIEKQPLNVDFQSFPKEPLNVNMNMNLSTRETIPVCIKICEPICARSEYKIAIDIFEKPFAGITFQGQTKVFACPEPPQDTSPTHGTILTHG
jgi:hypothetical protein